MRPLRRFTHPRDRTVRRRPLRHHLSVRTRRRGHQDREAAIGGDPARYTGPRLLGRGRQRIFPELECRQAQHHARPEIAGGHARRSRRWSPNPKPSSTICAATCRRSSASTMRACKAAQSRDRLPAYLGLWTRQRAQGVARLRLSDAGGSRPDEHHRRAKQSAVAVRAVDRRLHDRRGRHARAVVLPDAGAPTGKGCDVDTCLFDVALHQLGYTATWFLNHGDVTERHAAQLAFFGRAGADVPDRGRLGVRHVHDGKILDRLDLRRSTATILLADPRFARRKRAGSTAKRSAPYSTTSSARRPRQNGCGGLSGKLPVGPVYDLPQALQNPFVERPA